MRNNGHTLSADLSNQGYGGINYADAWYQLMYINVHALSEHTYAGAHEPAELHLVHKRYDSDALLIVAVPLACNSPPPQGGVPLPVGAAYVAPSPVDPNFNPAVQLLLKSAPPPTMMQISVAGDEVTGPDITALLRGAPFLGYAGSTTAPPCAETVTWLVRSQPVLASDTQVRYLYDAVYASTGGRGNYRVAMPLQGRDIVPYRAVLELAPSIPYDPAEAVQSGSMQTDREYRSMKWAKDALRIATASLDYVRNLDQRLHGAAQASSAALRPGSVLGPSPSPAAAFASPAPAALVPGGGGIPIVAGAAGASGTPLMAGAPGAGGTPMGAGAPIAADRAAAAMAAMVAQAAKDAIKNATAQIAAEANATAFQVAHDAANMVLQGMGAT
eukprot:CAMPEP_0115626940 /NCGR_PEP_ID=MMETSP0272-20121206/28607_1 /TAXON_ID=71861 /ORGANISM="Scrippsiella trochoidea, Strain CCMP3099" /LENGTH=386 /DNA_ID=CAMNT_0003063319 /DNA_START=13 /DNA_END=1173 /DNA_ORIENTATION=+